MKVSVEGTELVLEDGSRIRLRFLETCRTEGRGTVPRVKVYCQGCRRYKVVNRVGLRVTADGVVDLQPNCHECRGILNRRAARRSTPGE